MLMTPLNGNKLSRKKYVSSFLFLSITLALALHLSAALFAAEAVELLGLLLFCYVSSYSQEYTHVCLIYDLQSDLNAVQKY